MGVVRVMISESDYPEARKIIHDWDAKQSPVETTSSDGKKGSFGAGIMGFALGIAIMTFYYHTPVAVDGIDYNGDGILDEKWTYVNHKISKTEFDRNLDGTSDFIYSFDRKGHIKSALSDEDFNGSFETEFHYGYGNIVWQKSDTNGDGFKNYRIDFKQGVMETITFISPVTKKPIKTQQYGPFSLLSAEVDSTGDGVMDTFYEYDSIEEIANKSSR